VIDFKLEGKTAVVTGAGRGIGRQIALTLAEQGAKLVVADIVKESADRVAEEIVALGSEALPYELDVSNSQQVQKMANAAVKRFGRVDILVNNAGISPKRNGQKVPIVEMDLAEWEKVVGINLHGTFYCAQAFAKIMVKQNYGKIINMSSQAGRTYSNIPAAHYLTTKAGVIGLTRALAGELAPFGVNVNAIAPGRIETEMIKDVGAEVNKEYLKKIPVGRLGHPRDIAEAVLYLVSDNASFINGVTLDVNGGALIL